MLYDLQVGLRSSTKKILNRQPCPPDGISQKLETVARSGLWPISHIPARTSFNNRLPQLRRKAVVIIFSFRQVILLMKMWKVGKRKKDIPMGMLFLYQ